MNKFATFLRHAKSSLFSDESNLAARIVLGNTSSDMDSVVGSHVLAYMLTLQTSELWTPIVNCQKQDFSSKVEIKKHMVEDCGLNLEEHMVFWDDLLKCAATASKPGSVTQIALFDHNLLDPAQAS